MAKYFVATVTETDLVSGKAYPMYQDGGFRDEVGALRNAEKCKAFFRGHIVDLPEPEEVSAMQEAAEEFQVEYADHGCTCFKCAPCSYCTHPGNPLSLEEAGFDEDGNPLIERPNNDEKAPIGDGSSNIHAMESLCGYLQRLNDYQPVIESELPAFPSVPEQAFPGLLGGRWGG